MKDHYCHMALIRIKHIIIKNKSKSYKSADYDFSCSMSV